MSGVVNFLIAMALYTVGVALWMAICVAIATGVGILAHAALS